jgi:hypothetical protein
MAELKLIERMGKGVGFKRGEGELPVPLCMDNDIKMQYSILR